MSHTDSSENAGHLPWQRESSSASATPSSGATLPSCYPDGPGCIGEHHSLLDSELELDAMQASDEEFPNDVESFQNKSFSRVHLKTPDPVDDEMSLEQHYLLANGWNIIGRQDTAPTQNGRQIYSSPVRRGHGETESPSRRELASCAPQAAARALLGLDWLQYEATNVREHAYTESPRRRKFLLLCPRARWI